MSSHLIFPCKKEYINIKNDKASIIYTKQYPEQPQKKNKSNTWKTPKTKWKQTKIEDKLFSQHNQKEKRNVGGRQIQVGS